MPAATSANVSTVLSSMASGYENSEFIADQLMPVVEHENIQGTIKQYQRADEAEIDDDHVGPESEAAVVDYQISDTTFTCRARGLKALIPYSLIDNAAAPLDVEERKARNVMQRLKLRQERRVAAVLMTTTSYTTANRLTATAQWTNVATSDPVVDFDAMKAKLAGSYKTDEAGLFKVVVGLGLEAWQALKRHPKLLGLRGGGTQTSGTGTTSEVAQLLGVDEIWVSGAEYNTAARGATPSYSRIWDTTKCCMVRVPKTPPKGVDGLSLFGAQIRWKGANQFPWEAVTWDDPNKGPGRGSKVVKISHWTVEKTIQDDAGVILSTVT